MANMKWEYIHDHKIHVGGCDKVAFYYKKFPRPGAPIKSDDAQLLDGSMPSQHSAILCGSCGAHMSAPQIQCLRRKK